MESYRTTVLPWNSIVLKIESRRKWAESAYTGSAHFSRSHFVTAGVGVDLLPLELVLLELLELLVVLVSLEVLLSPWGDFALLSVSSVFLPLVSLATALVLA